MQAMTRSAVLTECAYISGILRSEFVYGVEGAEVNVNRTIEELIKNGILANEGDGDPTSGSSKIGISPLERHRGREYFDSFLFLIWPFVEAYWLACCSLLLLAPPSKRKGDQGAGVASDDSIFWFSAKDFEKRAQLFGKTLYQQGELAYLEAINLATLSQAVGRFEELGVVMRRKSESVKPIPLIALSPEYRPTYDGDQVMARGRLWDTLEHLSSFRREGKERRENLLGERIMRHVANDDSQIVEVTRRRSSEHDSPAGSKL